MRVLCIAILLVVIPPSYQKLYQCNPSATCGCSSKPASVNRIVGGELADNGTWSWLVLIGLNGDNRCGGSILSGEWILTAAHCVVDLKAAQLIVYAGSNIVWSGKQNRTVSQIITHSAYNGDTFVNDIALLRLTSPLNMTDPNLSTICLPSINSTTLATSEWPPANMSVVLAGWGRLADGGALPNSLQQVTLKTVDYRVASCNRSIADPRVQLCAGVPDGAKDACAGDSGGPLMMFSSNMQWVLIGLVSTGTGCADPLYSGIYTRVAAFESWIRLNTYAPNWIAGDVPAPNTLTDTSTSKTSTVISVSSTPTGTRTGFTISSQSAASALNCYHLFFLYFIYLSVRILL